MVEDCFCEPEKEAPGAYVSGSHFQPFLRPAAPPQHVSPNIITHAEKNQSALFSMVRRHSPERQRALSLQT